MAGDGWVSVGDACGFMDPLYSQGLDYCCHTIAAAERILLQSIDGGCVKQALCDYDMDYKNSYKRWYESLYHGKYEYIGDAELMWVAFMMDLSTYFLGPIRHVYEDTDGQFGVLPFHGPLGTFFGNIMAKCNERLAIISRKRWAAGVYGDKNLDRRYLVDGFIPRKEVGKKFIKALLMWAKVEIKALFLNPDPKLYAEAEALAMAAAPATPSMASEVAGDADTGEKASDRAAKGKGEGKARATPEAEAVAAKG